MIASKRGDIENVRYLLNANADVNASDYSGRTALILACSRTKEHVILIAQLLLAAGADVNAATSNGKFSSHQHPSIRIQT